MLNLADIELSSHARLDRLFCPLCGTQTLYEGGHNECPHLVYIYMPDLDEYIYLLPELERPVVQALGTLQDQANDDYSKDEKPALPNHPILDQYCDDGPIVGLFTYLDASRYLHLGLTRKDIACGPFEDTIFVGYDGWALVER